MGETVARPVENWDESPAVQSASPVRTAVALTQLEEVSDAPSPESDEFRFVSEPIRDCGMTLEDVLQHTVEHHPLLQARTYEVEAARGRLVTAGLLPNPQWVTDSESPVDRDGPTILSTRLTFAIPTGGKRRWRMAAAEADISRSQAALARETELILAEAADAAIEVLYLQELARMQDDLSQLAAKTAETVGGRFQAGATPYVDAIKSRLDAGEMELARLATRGRLEEARVRLNRAAGFSPAPLLQMRGELVVEPVPPLRLESVLAAAESNRPDLSESRAAVLESQRRYAQARAEARPDVVFGPRMQNELGEKGDRVGARMSINLPLFDRNQGGIAESAARVRSRCAMLDATEINTLSDVAAAYVELQAAQTQLDYHRTHVRAIVVETESAVRGAAAEKVLAPGQISELMEQLARLRVEELNLRYNHTRLRTRLEILVGCPLESLQEAG